MEGRQPLQPEAIRDDGPEGQLAGVAGAGGVAHGRWLVVVQMV